MVLGILLGFVLAGITGFILNQILWQQGLGPIRSFFEPQGVGHQTERSPFQVLLGCLGRIATLLGFALGMLWLGGVLLGAEPAFLVRVLSGLALADTEWTALLLPGLMALLIALGLRASNKDDKKD